MTSPDAVLVLAPGLVREHLDGELVAYTPSTHSMHHLDPLAMATVSLLDGSVSLSRVAAALAARFCAEPAVVLADVLELMDQLLRREIVLPAANRPPARLP